MRVDFMNDNNVPKLSFIWLMVSLSKLSLKRLAKTNDVYILFISVTMTMTLRPDVHIVIYNGYLNIKLQTWMNLSCFVNHMMVIGRYFSIDVFYFIFLKVNGLEINCSLHFFFVKFIEFFFICIKLKIKPAKLYSSYVYSFRLYFSFSFQVYIVFLFTIIFNINFCCCISVGNMRN